MAPGDPFHQNVVILTGASRGIGKALAFLLAGQGACQALAARDAELLNEVANECRRLGGEAIAIQTDVSDGAQCRHLVEQAIATYGRIDTVVNNAGQTMWSLFDDLQDLSVLEKLMQVNYFGSVYCTHAALPYLKQTHGRIVVVNSLTGKSGVPTRSGYAASKHALVGFFDTLRIELHPYGISVTSVYPDFVATETRMRAYGPDGKPIGTSPVQEGQVMSAEDCARIILEAAAKRKRDVIIGARGKLGLWLKLIAPNLVDRIARRAIARGR